MRKPSFRRGVALVAVGVMFIAAWAWLEVPPLGVLRDWAEHTGFWFPVLFWLLYVLITQLPIPRTFLTVSAGVLFGSVWGVAVSISAATASAVLSLLIVRGLLRDWVEPRLTHPAVAVVNRHLEDRGWLAVASLRLIPVVPFSILNYAAALTRVGVLPFAAATFAGSLPTTIIGVVFGDTLSGQANPAVVAITVVLTLVGCAGLLLDALLPTRRQNRAIESAS
ncbi:TVP38/TMEM64 family protein [Corynebacterium mayonis]|uniref:TVP38/TMEM64 family protein n=1 Tax=Corynebacterium mayonis TaxID=3062461 RepID=UPI0031407A14